MFSVLRRVFEDSRTYVEYSRFEKVRIGLNLNIPRGVTSFLKLSSAANAILGHPWVQLDDLVDDPSVLDGSAVRLFDLDGNPLGVGIYDRRDPLAAWRRFSWAEEAAFDEAYLLNAIQEAVERRPDEVGRRLVSSDMDFVPGLIAEQFGDVLTVRLETAAIAIHQKYIGGLLQEFTGAAEVVFLNDNIVRSSFDLALDRTTLSKNNLKGRWVEMDEVAFRMDFLNAEKPLLSLDQREQYVLVASLTEGRCVCDAFSSIGGFALHSARAGAEYVVALDTCSSAVKALGAAAQKNDCFVEAIESEASVFFDERKLGELDVIILDPGMEDVNSVEALQTLHEKAFRCLSVGGILATYCRLPNVSSEAFERLVSKAAARNGRDARIFARTTQPFDFPMLLSLPESVQVKGLIIELI